MDERTRASDATASVGRASQPPAGERERAPATHRRLSRGAALALAGALLGVLAIGWTADAFASLPPAPSSPPPLTQQAGTSRITLRFEPQAVRAGLREQITLSVVDAAGAPITGARIEVWGAGTDMLMSTPRVRADETSTPGRYQAKMVFSMNGNWRLRVSVTRGTQSPVFADFEMRVT